MRLLCSSIFNCFKSYSFLQTKSIWSIILTLIKLIDTNTKRERFASFFLFELIKCIDSKDSMKWSQLVRWRLLENFLSPILDLTFLSMAAISSPLSSSLSLRLRGIYTTVLSPDSLTFSIASAALFLILCFAMNFSFSACIF